MHQQKVFIRVIGHDGEQRFDDKVCAVFNMDGGICHDSWVGPSMFTYFEEDEFLLYHLFEGAPEVGEKIEVVLLEDDEGVLSITWPDCAAKGDTVSGLCSVEVLKIEHIHL